MPLIEHKGPPPETGAPGTSPLSVCVAIPARDEEARIGACFASLAAQTTSTKFAVLVLANNCADATADIVRSFGADAPFDVHLFEAWFKGCAAPAARARRLSVNAAMSVMGPQGMVLTTDADSRVDPNWVEANLDGLRRADLVCGAISPDIWELGVSFPDRVLQRGASEFTLEQMAVEMEHRLDPLSWDPWPHHRMETAASLAISTEWLLRVGGVPEVEPGEDRALVNIVRRMGGRVRHAPDAKVVTSCRLDGRARGGWADDLKERVEDPSVPCHDNLEPSFDLYRRAKIRGALRAAWPAIDVAAWARVLRLPAEIVRAHQSNPNFAEAWAELEALSPRLKRVRLQVNDLPRQTQVVARLLARTRVETAKRQPALAPA